MQVPPSFELFVPSGQVVLPQLAPAKLALDEFPAVSVAVQDTVVDPIGKTLPEAGEQLTVAASSGSLAETEYVTTAPFDDVPLAVTVPGTVIVGGVVSCA